MGIPHQAFNCKRIIVIVSFLILCSFIPAQALAYDSLFIVEDVKVDITAENSVTAQNQAFEKAQTQAFQVLTQRMVEEAQAETIALPGSLTISSLVKDYEITDEQLSSVRYVGTYTFRFREAAVSNFFSVSGVNFTDTSSKPLLVLPVFQKDGKNTLWSEGNLWMRAWSAAQLSGGLVPVEVPIGDLMDIADIDEDQALSYERRKLDRMLARYNAKEAAIMIAVPDVALSGLQGKQSRAVGRLRISVYRTDLIQAQHVQDIELVSDGRETLEQIYERGVSLAYSSLQKDWKSKTLASAAQSQNFLARVSFENIRQWAQVQKALMNVSSLSEVSILSMKKAEARISFKFRGDETRLREALLRTHMSLSQGYPYGSQYKYTENERNDVPVMYDIVYGKRAKKSVSQSVEPSSGISNTPNDGYGVHTF